MRRITKQKEPPTLTEYRQGTPHPTWDGYADKRSAQAALYEEQKSICCFCQRRIVPDEQPTDRALVRNMKIAHFVPRKSAAGQKSPALEVTWNNLFGVCMGGEASEPGKQSLPADEQHCDTKQGNAELYPELNPLVLKPGIVKFRRSGVVYSDNQAVDADLNQKLNLNARAPKAGRLAARDALIQLIEANKPGHWSAATILRRIDEIERQVPLSPYCDFLLFILKERLRAS